MKNQFYLTTDRVELIFEIPLGEIVFDFYDKLKSVSKDTHLLIIPLLNIDLQI